ncbi:MAG TPA: aminotransferase class I/II-fold pyridoxal phosphate-dependent enzyme [Pseudonocardia sp.]|nr:aminotransferase class I/II-fold pyridoxal phosphate-dependent enzyme [Pseudonocardia sp.]
MVSKQAARLAADSPAIAVAHLRAEADPYDPERNPAGHANLGTAENRLTWDLIAGVLTGPRPLEPADVRYGPLHGSDRLRAVTARLLARTWDVPVDPEHLVVVTGATAALDLAASVLCDPGEAIVLPAPYYAALDTDLTGRSGAVLVPAPLDPAAGLALGPEPLERAVRGAQRRGLTVRALMVTSPENPTGVRHSPQALRAVLEVAHRHGLDLLADEIYANTVFGPEPFVSVLHSSVRGGLGMSPLVVWGFAKDFGLPGLKVGVLYSEDPEVLAAARALAYFAPVSTDTQWLLCRLLADEDGVQELLAELRRRLAASYARCADGLTARGIAFLPAQAGLSVWIDLRRGLGPDGEPELWRRLVESRVNVLPGGVFGGPQPGWFRLCHATDPATVTAGLDRIAAALAAAPGGRQR